MYRKRTKEPTNSNRPEPPGTQHALNHSIIHNVRPAALVRPTLRRDPRLSASAAPPDVEPRAPGGRGPSCISGSRSRERSPSTREIAQHSTVESGNSKREKGAAREAGRSAHSRGKGRIRNHYEAHNHWCPHLPRQSTEDQEQDREQQWSEGGSRHPRPVVCATGNFKVEDEIFLGRAKKEDSRQQNATHRSLLLLLNSWAAARPANPTKIIAKKLSAVDNRPPK